MAKNLDSLFEKVKEFQKKHKMEYLKQYKSFEEFRKSYEKAKKIIDEAQPMIDLINELKELRENADRASLARTPYELKKQYYQNN